MITIASAGCNVLDYIIEGARVTAVDFNACQVSPQPIMIHIVPPSIPYILVLAESMGDTKRCSLAVISG